MAVIQLESVVKSFGSVKAVNDLSLRLAGVRLPVFSAPMAQERRLR